MFEIGDQMVAENAALGQSIRGIFQGWGRRDDGETYVALVDEAFVWQEFPTEGGGWTLRSP